jgi:hypothetical protein
MSDIEQRINELVSGFVNEITRLAREAAKTTLEAALAGTHGAVADARSGRRGRGGRGAVAASPAPVAASTRRPKGAKRPANEITETKEKVHAHIRANPGQRIEQINKMLGTRTSDLSLPLKKLLAEGAIRTEGERRATKYFPGDGKPAGGGGGGGKASRGRRKKKS